MGNPLLAIRALGQSIWLDNISRELLDSGKLAQPDRRRRHQRRDLQPDHLREGHRPLGALRPRAQRRRARRPRRARDLLPLAYADIRDGADLLRPAYDAADGQDGHISFELPPELALDAAGSIEAAQAHLRGDRPPERAHQGARDARGRRGVPRAHRGRRLGQRDAAVRRRALRGDRERLDRRPRAARRRRRAGRPARLGRELLRLARGRQGRRAPRAARPHASCRASPPSPTPSSPTARSSGIFSGPRWEALAAKGAHVQRPLWASTSTKNPAYPDTLYVDTLIGPDTVNTMPEATIDATRDHGARRAHDRRQGRRGRGAHGRARAPRRRPRPDPRCTSSSTRASSRSRSRSTR